MTGKCEGETMSQLLPSLLQSRVYFAICQNRNDTWARMFPMSKLPFGYIAARVAIRNSQFMTRTYNVKIHIKRIVLSGYDIEVLYSQRQPSVI